MPLSMKLSLKGISVLPSSLKLRGQENKYIFKKALEPQLSDDILYRDKMGFPFRWPAGSAGRCTSACARRC